MYVHCQVPINSFLCIQTCKLLKDRNFRLILLSQFSLEPGIGKVFTKHFDGLIEWYYTLLLYSVASWAYLECTVYLVYLGLFFPEVDTCPWLFVTLTNTSKTMFFDLIDSIIIILAI